MKPRSFYKLLAVTVVAFVVALSVWILTPTYSTGNVFGEPFIPGLIDKINDVATISVEHEGRTMTFNHDEKGEWFLAQADNYPADKERIRNILIGIANLEKIEPKTALPEFYPDLQVEDIKQSDAKSYLISLINNQGQSITKLLIGKKTRGLSWNGQGYFVRFPDDPQSWLVRGNVDVTGDMRSWMATRLLPLTKGRTSSITLVDGTKTREAVYKRSAPAMAIQPSFLSDGYFIIASDFIEKMEEALTSFNFKNVTERPDNIGQEIPFASAFIETFDGLNIYLFMYLPDGQPFVAVSFAATEKADENVKKEAKELEELHQNWLYQMPEETVTAILPFLSVPAEKNTQAPSVKETKTETIGEEKNKNDTVAQKDEQKEKQQETVKKKVVEKKPETKVKNVEKEDVKSTSSGKTATKKAVTKTNATKKSASEKK